MIVALVLGVGLALIAAVVWLLTIGRRVSCSGGVEVRTETPPVVRACIACGAQLITRPARRRGTCDACDWLLTSAGPFFPEAP